MDRRTVYYGQLAQETDVLLAGQFAMVGLAKFSEAVLGTSSIVDGFAVTQTVVASLNVLMGPGSIYSSVNLEQSTWSSVPADLSRTILKQGIALDTQTITGITAPGTGGFSQVYLIEIQYSDIDSGSTVLPYYNAANPTSPFSGPGNAGTAQNTIRKGVASYQLKAGTPAATGTQVTPSADAGWTGICAITVANGQTTIVAGNINMLTTAPFVFTKLPRVPFDAQSGKWSYADDTGTTNNFVITLNPVPASYQKGMIVSFKAANTVTGACVLNVNGLGNKTVAYDDGNTAIRGGDILTGAIVVAEYTGTFFQVIGFLQSAVKKTAFKRTRQTFTTPGGTSMVVPAGITTIRIYAWGAAGGGGFSGALGGGSGGGGGAYGEQTLDVSPGDTVNIVIGTGGAGAASTASNGTPGGNTTVQINAGTVYTAGGGSGGQTVTSGAANSVSGGTTTNFADIARIGQPSAGSVSGYNSGTTALWYAGKGGDSPNGGLGGLAGTGAGNPGSSPGGGGGGTANNSGTAGAGARGEVWVEY